MIVFAFWIISHLHFGYTLAPELIQGTTVSVHARDVRVAYVDGGDWSALQVGISHGDKEIGVFLHVDGKDIDNDNMPVSYNVDWRDSGKYRGFIQYRGHERKLCYAPLRKTLPCR
mgnify:CR=1 FL=1